MRFNPPPGWPTPPEGWTPPPGWKPDPAWPAPPPGWNLFVSDDEAESDDDVDESATVSTTEASTGPAQEAPGTGPTETFAGPAAGLPFRGVDPAPLLARIADLEAALAAARSGADVIDLSDQRALQDVGIYRYHHPLESAAAYKDRLRSLEGQIDDVVKSGRAIVAADMFTFDGSLARGRKLVGDLSKLMLRAYNAEADNCVRSLRSGNVRTAQKRLESAVTAIERLGAIMEMRISPEYHALRIAELELTADFQMKVQEERERGRQERQLLREQRRAEQELAAEKERLEKERAHYISVLESLRAKGDDTAVTELSRRLADIEKAIAANDYRIANIRAGYVYVISNVGAFGPNIVKIGMTRRLEPMDRVRELGDASVPFRYDVHAMFFSEDAVTLESELHKAFADRRVNFVNERREFFFATPSEVRALLADRVGGLLEFTEEPAALEYFQSRSRWPQQS
ncbi:T5orf172 domain-containing protein [Streptomyces puniciscabiei]|uniref:T5orf172 domain-containing protein n=1 Tax=Streptomyces puniciscabiei TaxID=164348 RepID=A0A542UJF8_9ACTN|nr:T5orf172 domain-containing protein [Streptomyces puniciscabiei]